MLTTAVSVRPNFKGLFFDHILHGGHRHHSVPLRPARIPEELANTGRSSCSISLPYLSEFRFLISELCVVGCLLATFSEGFLSHLMPCGFLPPESLQPGACQDQGTLKRVTKFLCFDCRGAIRLRDQTCHGFLYA